MSEIEVKALEWEYREQQMMTYVIMDYRGIVYHINQTFGSDSYYFTTVRYDGEILYDGDDLPSAKAAAQSDYEARIRSALVERKEEPLEHVEKVSTEAAMSQWERSLKRPDLCEKDRVRGAIEAYKRQAFAFAISPTPPAAPVTMPDDIALKAEYLALNILNVDNLDYAKEAIICALMRERAAFPSPVGSRDGLEAATVKALENARTQILSAYRVWVADDIEAFPPPKTQAGEVIAQIDALLAAKEQQP